jgi:hypothetical protein
MLFFRLDNTVGSLLKCALWQPERSCFLCNLISLVAPSMCVLDVHLSLSCVSKKHNIISEMNRGCRFLHYFRGNLQHATHKQMDIFCDLFEIREREEAASVLGFVIKI